MSEHHDLSAEDLAEYERLLEALRGFVRCSDLAIVAAMEARITERDDLDLDGKCLLFGFDGQVDVAWDVPAPRAPRATPSPSNSSQRSDTRRPSHHGHAQA